ncbi:telethonin [Equus asinus]|uniref:Telethonin n=2 Tax=Equus TaxID=9789 RepID=A0A9L0JRJ7_EQUAS|nr:telethonin [Equus caballus]XP_008517106.1 PREDICTED: telethonin [Equus przewalskii]XP_014689208.1 telethonin [Equus asinus]XP_046531964.1 telethonin [Equus quagga]
MATSELSCQVSEENRECREAFWAEWKDLTLSTRPEEGCSLHEEDAQRRETYHRQGQCQALVQRSPWLVMRMGILGRGLQEYQLPYQRVLPLPIFTPTKVGAKEEHEDTPIQLQDLLAMEAALGGQCVDRQDVAEITKQLPPVVPVSKPGALHRSLSRSMSQEAQRG